MRRTIKFMALALVVALSMTSCKKEYTITVMSNNTNWGTTEGTGVYVEGKSVKIAAFPKSGYYFIKWNDNVTDNPRTIQVTGDATYTAYFSDDPNGGGQGGDTNNTDPLTMSGTISSNVTWADRGLPVDYIVEGTINIDGNALLTIAPGVTIMFTGTDGGFYVGENAGLRMVGTADKPIVFQGPTNNPNNGSWYGITINSTRSDNQFEYVQFLRGGSGSANWEGVVNVNGRLSMKHCTINGSLNNGLSIQNDGYMTAFENNEIKNCGASPIYSENFAGACKNIGTGNTFSGNTTNRVHVFGQGYLENENLTIHNIGIPYFFENGGFDGDGRTLTIEAGVVIEVPANTNLNVGGNLCFVANGTSSSPIIFRADDGANWNGMTFFSERSGNSLSYCQFQNGGRGTDWDNHACLYIGQSAVLSLTNNVFGPSLHYGVAIEHIENWGNVTHSGNTFTNCQGGNVYIEYGGEYGGTEYEDGQVLNQLP